MNTTYHQYINDALYAYSRGFDDTDKADHKYLDAIYSAINSDDPYAFVITRDAIEDYIDTLIDNIQMNLQTHDHTNDEVNTWCDQIKFYRQVINNKF